MQNLCPESRRKTASLPAFIPRDWAAFVAGLDTPQAWQTWATSDTPPALPATLAPELPSPKTPRIPMMTARRLSTGSRFAVQVASELLDRHPSARALVFSSRHGEIERTEQILSAIAARAPISPTDFAMAVHNTAVGQFTITAKRPLPASSVAAGAASFQQALFEVRAFLAAGLGPVLHVDFETRLPEIYHSRVSPVFPAYAVAFLWEDAPAAPPENFPDANSLPQSLAFLRTFLRQKEAPFSTP